MSSSRSDVVTQCVRLSVRHYLFFPCVSLESVVHLEISIVFQGCSKVFQRFFEVVSRAFQRCIKSVSMRLQGRFMGLPSVFQRCFKGCFKIVSMIV